MGVSLSSPAIQHIAATLVTTISSSGSPSTVSTSTSFSTVDPQFHPPPSQQDDDKVFVKIRDFAFQPSDERHNGQGQLVPRTNRIGRMNRQLGGRSCSTSSISSSDSDSVDEGDAGNGQRWNVGGYRARGLGYGGWGGGRFSWTMNSSAGVATAATIFDQEKSYVAAAANLSAAASKASGDASEKRNIYPSWNDMDLDFLDSESDEYYDAEDDGVYDAEEDEGTFEDAMAGGEELPFPGLYRALYAFEPQGTAEMRLVEDQIVRVIGRGGGIGWAVVVAESEGHEDEDCIGDSTLKATKHALVPESYLEPYKLDWEFDESGGTNWRTT